MSEKKKEAYKDFYFLKKKTSPSLKRKSNSLWLIYKVSNHEEANVTFVLPVGIAPSSQVPL